MSRSRVRDPYCRTCRSNVDACRNSVAHDRLRCSFRSVATWWTGIQATGMQQIGASRRMAERKIASRPSREEIEYVPPLPQIGSDIASK